MEDHIACACRDRSGCRRKKGTRERWIKWFKTALVHASFHHTSPLDDGRVDADLGSRSSPEMDLRFRFRKDGSNKLRTIVQKQFDKNHPRLIGRFLGMGRTCEEQPTGQPHQKQKYSHDPMKDTPSTGCKLGPPRPIDRYPIALP